MCKMTQENFICDDVSIFLFYFNSFTYNLHMHEVELDKESKLDILGPSIPYELSFQQKVS